MTGGDPSAEVAGERDFAWRDGERIVLFRGGLLPGLPEVIGEHGWTEFDLLSTERALAAAPPELAAAARAVHQVAPGAVPEAAVALLDRVSSGSIVALGGGRVIDSAKAVGAVTGARVCAVPTTLSGAEMTRIHRLPPGSQAALIRPQLVLADPDSMASQPEAELRASAMNALAHGAEALVTPFANPVASMAALRGASLLASGLDAGPGGTQRRVALGSILCAYALDSALFCLHHVACQTLVRVLEIPHAEANATMLPHTLAVLAGRAPRPLGALAEVLDTDSAGLPARVAGLGGAERRLGDLGADESGLEQVVTEAAARPELGFTPGPPLTRDDLEELLRSAW